MGGTCSCENNNAPYNVDTYHSVTYSKNYRSIHANDIFEERLNRKNLLDHVIKKNIVRKIQRWFKKIKDKENIRKQTTNTRVSLTSSDNGNDNKSKQIENKYDTFGYGDKANSGNISKSPNGIYIPEEERLAIDKFFDDLELNSAYFNGKISNKNKIEGYGTLILKDSTQINGWFKNDNLNGYAQIMTFQSEFFQGLFVNSTANGFGMYIMKKIVEYVGEWQDNRKHGYGMETRYNNSIYTGDYLYGKKEGFGFLKLSDGSYYQGYLKDNNFNGYGLYTFSDGRLFMGEWKNSVMDGYGEFLWKDGNKYFGYYKSDKKEGFGIFYWPGTIKFFVGFWKNGKQEGVGKKFTKDKVKYSLWKAGKILTDYEKEEHFIAYFTLEQKIYLKFFKMDIEDLLEFFSL